MSKFKVVIKRTFVTELIYDAESYADTRRRIESYGIAQTAIDYAKDDEQFERIVSIRKVE